MMLINNSSSSSSSCCCYWSPSLATLLLLLLLLLLQTYVATAVDGDADDAVAKAKLLQTKLSNYKEGKGVIILIHITHHGGTFIRTKLARANKEYISNPWKTYDSLPGHMTGSNRTNFFKMLLPSLYNDDNNDNNDNNNNNNKNTHNNNSSSLYNVTTNNEMLPPLYNVTTNNETVQTHWDVLYENGKEIFGSNFNFFIWFELSWIYHKAKWAYHPFPPYNEPNLWLLDWESPNVVSVIVTRNPMDRLLSKNSAIKDDWFVQYEKDGNNTNNNTALSKKFWNYAYNQDRFTNNYALRNLATPYYDISRDGLQSAKLLLNRMDYIIDQDCLNENLIQFCQDIGWDHIDDILDPTPHHKPAKDRIHNDTIYNYLRDKNKFDIELYEWSKTKSLVVCPTTTTTSSTSTSTKATTTTTDDYDDDNKNKKNNDNKDGDIDTNVESKTVAPTATSPTTNIVDTSMVEDTTDAIAPAAAAASATTTISKTTEGLVTEAPDSDDTLAQTISSTTNTSTAMDENSDGDDDETSAGDIINMIIITIGIGIYVGIKIYRRSVMIANGGSVVSSSAEQRQDGISTTTTTTSPVSPGATTEMVSLMNRSTR